jgi:alkylation response protein AidB-like acyl-CoA dehydrogenase
VDFDLTREQEMIRKEVRKFAQSEIAPVALELDEQRNFLPTSPAKWVRSVCSACLS